MNKIQSENQGEINPPIFGSWKMWYWAVIGNLAFLILLFYLFTRYYS